MGKISMNGDTMRYQFAAATALTTTLIGLVPAATAQDSFDWSGFYFGGTMGVITQNTDASASFPSTPIDPTNGFTFNNNSFYFQDTLLADLPTAFDLDSASGQIGLTAGYNLQSGSFVWGAEGDISLLTNNSTTSTYTEEAAVGGTTTLTVTSQLHALSSVRGRVGIAADRLLLFATAGIAGGATSLSTSLDFEDNSKSSASSGSSSNIALGVIAGVGAEYAVNDNVSLKAEGLYYALAGDSVTATGSGEDAGGAVDVSSYSVSNQNSGAIVRFGLNYRF
jgi:outer membrane immunogenic protein